MCSNKSQILLSFQVREEAIVRGTEEDRELQMRVNSFQIGTVCPLETEGHAEGKPRLKRT